MTDTYYALVLLIVSLLLFRTLSITTPCPPPALHPQQVDQNGKLTCKATVWDDQIRSYLLPFHRGFNKTSILAGVNLFVDHQEPGLLVVIEDNAVYAAHLARRSDGKSGVAVTPFKAKNDDGSAPAFFVYLARAICSGGLPNLVFVYQGSDLPKVLLTDPPVPVFSWSGSAKHQDIMLPYGSAMHVSGWRQLTFPDWDDRLDKAVWRGSQTGGIYTKDNFRSFPRTRLCYICKAALADCDAGFAKYTQVTDEAKTLISAELGLKPHIGWWDHAKYKYVLQLDGNGPPASRALPFMFQGSLIMKQDSMMQEFFYPSLSPYVHYLPIDANVSDVLNRIRWAKANDVVAKKIADNAKQWACAHLHDAEITCYVVRLMRQYAALQNFTTSAFRMDPMFANLTRVRLPSRWLKETIQQPEFVPNNCDVYN